MYINDMVEDYVMLVKLGKGYIVLREYLLGWK